MLGCKLSFGRRYVLNARRAFASPARRRALQLSIRVCPVSCRGSLTSNACPSSLASRRRNHARSRLSFASLMRRHPLSRVRTGPPLSPDPPPDACRYRAISKGPVKPALLLSLQLQCLLPQTRGPERTRPGILGASVRVSRRMLPASTVAVEGTFKRTSRNAIKRDGIYVLAFRWHLCPGVQLRHFSLAALV
jgi:hypothetical protein